MKLAYRQPLLFAVSGIAGFITDAGILYAASAAGLGYFAGRAISFLCAVWVTWQINRRYTFAADRRQSAWSEWLNYLAAMSAGGAVNYAAYTAAIVTLQLSPAVRPLAAVAMGSLAGMIVNYATAKLWVFSSRTHQQ
ncbi:GtrA family protein [Paraburkholderia largidicola]|uniref:GtrA/DPMS transmembrane domain-containing protein n=1 Tax=Paraburkholderia largidicola TaxID=3014751 RepID=A0A7I8C3I3_9BURK|nr:GtrA family protein [Paraburkholderia sp. PGU16]BCF95373.1 hypothetical protein PPGU16_84400 [Paraburkholderia sp. PGU16]